MRGYVSRIELAIGVKVSDAGRLLARESKRLGLEVWYEEKLLRK